MISTAHRLGNLQRLLAVVRLGYVEIVDIHADIARIHRIQRMLRIDKSRDPAALLHLGYHMQSHSRLTARLRTVDLNDTSLRNAAKTERDVQAQRARGNRLDIHMSSRIPELHHGTLSKLLLNLRKRSVQCFQLIFLCHLLSPSLELMFVSVLILLQPASLVKQIFSAS